MLQIEDPVVLPTAAQVKRLEALRKNNLSIFQFVSLVLQEEGTTVADVRAIFDDVIAEIPDTTHHLNSTAAIVKHAPFENALVKIQRGQGGELTAAELKAAQNLIVTDESEEIDVDAETGLGFAARALQRRRIAEQQEHRFMDTVFWCLHPIRWSGSSRRPSCYSATRGSVCCLKRWNSYCSCVQKETCGV
ncbi:hypothetical protein PI124_g19767 [Phytophthora idaei]|nr:hypothetical protein PI124_g19767 [Phytophthora idaei]